jgi:hypothetical protein
MTKYGVCDPVAVCIIPYLDQDRQLSALIAGYCPYDFKHPEDVIRWIMRVSLESLLRSGINPVSAEAAIRKRSWQRHPSERQDVRTNAQVRLIVDQEAYSSITLGDKLLVVPDENRNNGEFRVFTLHGRLLGRSGYSGGAIPGWWADIHLVDSEVSDKAHSKDGSYEITISVLGI